MKIRAKVHPNFARQHRLLKAIRAFDRAFCKYGEVIEGERWMALGPDAWCELVLAMDELRAVARIEPVSIIVPKD